MIYLLINNRLALLKGSPSSTQQKATMQIEANTSRPYDNQPNDMIIGFWRNLPVILNRSLPTVEDEVDAGVDVFVLDLGVVRDVGTPIFRSLPMK